VHERRGAQGMVGPLGLQMPVGDRAKVVVQELDDAVERGAIALGPALHQAW